MEPLGPLGETLDTELKAWLNLSDKRDGAKLAKACIALRNSNGGRVILGINNETLDSIPFESAEKLEEAYHPDKLNQIIGLYASPKFEITCSIKNRNGSPHPEIRVPAGVEFPVITRRPFEHVLRQNAVYVRTISNGRASSSEPKTPQDWETLIRTCFDNREADIARFVKRHLSQILAQLQNPSIVSENATQAEALTTAAKQLLDRGLARFKSRWCEIQGAAWPADSKIGFQEVAFIANGDFPQTPLADLLDKLFLHQPHMTGWPPWVDSRSFHAQLARPYVKERGWEAFVPRLSEQWSENAIDFWRIQPNGHFYHLRTLEDDTARRLQKHGATPGQTLDFLLLIARTAEILFTAKAFAKALGVDSETGQLAFAFRWTRLRGRTICCWVEPARDLHRRVKAEDDEVISTYLMGGSLPDAMLWQAVNVVVQPVFDAFGAGVGDKIFEEITNRTINREV